MKMVPVISSDLAAVGFEGGVLHIQFHSGGLYEYSGVPETESPRGVRRLDSLEGLKSCRAHIIGMRRS